MVRQPYVTEQWTGDDERRDATFLYPINAETGLPFDPSKDARNMIVKGRGQLIAGVRYYSSDIILYRYADVLLMIAEAKNALGQDPSAEMNLIRQRAYKDAFDDHVFISGTKEQNDQAILKERLLELAVEGKRWWDLVRFGKAFELVPSLQGRESEQYLLYFPIDLEVLSMEPLVEQVEGWEY